MRYLFLSLFLQPLIRNPSAQSLVRKAAAFPILSYPICVRNFTCSAPQKQNFQIIMADLKKEELAEVERMAESPCNEAEMLKVNKARGEAEVLKTQEVETKKEEEQPKLPKLSAADFRTYNSMSEHMDYFHNHFRQSWNTLYNACLANKRPSNLSLKAFLSLGIQFCSHLTAHHSIEEKHIFPILAQKMPEFKNGKNAAELLRQHKEIHKGMDGFEEYLQKCRRGEADFELSVLKQKMDSWGEVLWTHLDQEVKTLGAENMRRYWTLEEMRSMPM